MSNLIMKKKINAIVLTVQSEKDENERSMTYNKRCTSQQNSSVLFQTSTMQHISASKLTKNVYLLQCITLC